MRREKFQTRTIRLTGPRQLETALALLPHVPLDDERPLQLVVREEPKQRGLDANARMWAGPLADIAGQAWLRGRKFSDEVWHEFFKREYLPDDATMSPEELAEHVKDPEAYRKWDIDPAGERVLVGSTTELTPRGFAIYLQQIEAYGAELGVQFSASPRERMAA